MKHNTIAETFTLAALALLALGIAPTANAADKGCSVATLKGTFAINGTGSILVPPQFAGPIGIAGTNTFDGNGGVTGAGMLNQSGSSLPITETGTYTVNSDCTGVIVVQIGPIAIAAHYYFVIDQSVTELQMLCTDDGVVFSAVAKRQFPIGDWRQ